MYVSLSQCLLSIGFGGFSRDLPHKVLVIAAKAPRSVLLPT